MSAPFAKLFPRTTRFLTEERAALSVEAAVMLPILGFLYVAGFGYFDAYRKETVLTKATYTIGDLLSRQEGTVTKLDFEQLQEVFEFVTFSEGNTQLRFSELRRTGDELEVVWSYATDGGDELTEARLQEFLNQVPTLQDNERVVIVESYTLYQSQYRIGLEDRIMSRFVPTRSRYTARLAYDPTIDPPEELVNVAWNNLQGNNGWGNGDQDAAGNSGDNNNAENSDADVPNGIQKQNNSIAGGMLGGGVIANGKKKQSNLSQSLSISSPDTSGTDGSSGSTSSSTSSSSTTTTTSTNSNNGNGGSKSGSGSTTTTSTQSTDTSSYSAPSTPDTSGTSADTSVSTATSSASVQTTTTSTSTTTSSSTSSQTSTGSPGTNGTSSSSTSTSTPDSSTDDQDRTDTTSGINVEGQ